VAVLAVIVGLLHVLNGGLPLNVLDSRLLLHVPVLLYGLGDDLVDGGRGHGGDGGTYAAHSGDAADHGLQRGRRLGGERGW